MFLERLCRICQPQPFGFFLGDTSGFVGTGVGCTFPLVASSVLFILVGFAFPVTFATGFGIFVSLLGTLSGVVLVGLTEEVPVLV